MKRIQTPTTTQRPNEYRCPANGTGGHTYVFRTADGRPFSGPVKSLCRYCGQLMPGAPPEGVYPRAIETEVEP